MFQLGKYALLSFQLAGLSASAFLVWVTYFNPDQVEDRLKNFAIEKVEVAADAAWIEASNSLEQSSRAERLAALAEKFRREESEINKERETLVPALVAFALSDRCTENCGVVAIYGFAKNFAMLQQAAQLRVGQTTIGEFIVERYETTVQQLTMDLRRFGIVNLVTLALMSALLLLKDVLNWRFAALSISVTGYAAWAAYGYIYTQDWARTVLLQDWAAGGYQATMIFVCCLFSDWLFLRGQVTRLVMDAVASFAPG